jgi:hypothetical protein
MSNAVPDRSKWRSPHGLYDFYKGDPWPAGNEYSHSAWLPQRGGVMNGPHPASVRSHLRAMGNPSTYAWELGEEGDKNNYGNPRVFKTPKDLRKETN